MLEYVFFHQVLAQEFAEKARSYHIDAELIKDELAWEVHLPEDIDEKIEQKLCDYYDILFDKDQEMYENEHTENGYSAAAIEITLKSKQKVHAQTDQKIMAKILSALTFDELNILVADIVYAVENPDERSICQRHREMNEK